MEAGEWRGDRSAGCTLVAARKAGCTVLDVSVPSTGGGSIVERQYVRFVVEPAVSDADPCGFATGALPARDLHNDSGRRHRIARVAAQRLEGLRHPSCEVTSASLYCLKPSQ
jgi:hypothetical protein